MSEIVTIDLGISGTRKFTNSYEAKGYIDSQLNLWRSVLDYSGIDHGNFIQDNGIIQRVISGQGSHDAIVHAYATKLLFPTESKYFEILVNRQNEAGFNSFALGFLTAFYIKYRNINTLRQDIIQVNPYYIEGMEAAKDISYTQDIIEKIQSTAGITDEIKNTILNTYKNASSINEDIEKKKAYIDAHTDAINEKYKKLSDGLNDAIKVHEEETINKIQNLSASITQQELIKTTSGYWDKKQTSHKKSKEYLITIGSIYAIISIFIIFFGAIIIPPLLKTHGDHEDYFIIFILGTLLTIIFWIGRLISRSLVSEQHLATSSEERKVFIETYLALIKEGAATDKERHLMLSTIFKSSSDGLVKEDASVDTSLAASVSKFLAK